MQKNNTAPTRDDTAGNRDHATADLPQVLGVHVGKAHDFTKSPRTSIRLIENHGVEGDAHAGPTDQHLFHIRRFGKQPNLRQVHLIQAEFFDEVADKEHLVGPGALGENITTRGVDLLALPTGTRLYLGDGAVIELTGLRNPCHQIDTFQSGLLQHCKEATPDGVVRKAGVMAIVLQGGEVKPGDNVSIHLPPTPHQPLVYRTPITDQRTDQRTD